MSVRKSFVTFVVCLWACYCVSTSAQLQADYTQDFERLDAGALAPAKIHTQFSAPDAVIGVSGQAWRSDGFSSWLEIPWQSGPELSATLWVALESYPSDREVPVNNLSPSSILNQWEEGAGFDVFIDTYGRWGIRVHTEEGEITLTAPERFPLYRWVQLGVSIDRHRVALYLEGEVVVEAELAAPLRPADAPLQIARSPREVDMLNFTVNRLNGAFDSLRLYQRGLSSREMTAVRAQVAREKFDAQASLVVPASRFADDHLRPRLHAMPPANWTNEPHGFVRVGEMWHLFYQRTPNGPYKTQMHWGHMASRDLLHWRNLEDALWPELQADDFGFDMKGIWSGDVIYDGGKAFAFYTSVNHFDRLKHSNPGISVAVSEDPELRYWRKLGPIINSKYVRDFRDPYLFRDGDSLHMLIGAALEDGGGLDHYVLEGEEKIGPWRHLQKFVSVPYHEMDIGSLIWEMPVFERISDDAYILLANPIGGEVTKYGEPATRAVYWIGQWRDGLFHPRYTEPKHLDLLPGHLAPTVARAPDGSLRAIGIIDERRSPQAQENAGWAHTFSFPRRWRLLGDGRTLGQSPAPELTALRGKALFTSKTLSITPQAHKLLHPQGAYELLIEAQGAPPLALKLDLLASDAGEYTRLEIDGVEGRLVLDKTHASLSGEDEGPLRLETAYDSSAFGPLRRLRVFVDGSVIEVFINDAAAFSFRSYPKDPMARQVRVQSLGRDQSGQVRVSAWPLFLPSVMEVVGTH
ncbi:GH32 C-terminal domain-containing protein [Microbulbifer thermotolerans]|uniref:GH32 C-terminal domain-containing protein n=1 Tax=Microbulbifer thermotolerans TaxID=252514 RepID=UPI00224B4FCD|nr:GH32 C-terminal domain-containing protein [Microbulbifer thermotolerans]MCX2841250.1 GH32 C-terminal domain-containing protein [Microbulbifer thermotolerans]